MSIDAGRQPTDLSERVAEEIRALLGRRRMSGRELARRLDVSPSWVSYRLTGQQPIDVNDLSAIAAALDVSVISLLPAEERKREVTGGSHPRPRNARPRDSRPPTRSAQSESVRPAFLRPVINV
jgi:transcriptional regulator with XRE-family HTH domain